MSDAATPYAGRTIAFATMHRKEELAREAFAGILGARITAPKLDTDQFGTFAGDIPRTLSPIEAARAKAELGMRITGLTSAIASEGSFSAGSGWATRQTEHVLFRDQERGIELVESTTGAFPVPPGRHITDRADALSYARRIGFPAQGVIIQGHRPERIDPFKNVRSDADLERIVDQLLAENVPVSVLPDYRAHRSPARAETIRALCTRMAQRLATPCPDCGAPGFGRVGIIRGLPCALCRAPTHLPTADLLGCGLCQATEAHPHRQSLADPQWCDRCNP